MNKAELITELELLPSRIEAVERDVLTQQQEVSKAKEALANKEADLYTEGKIDGKNAEIRNAQLRQFTTQERNEVARAENDLNLARIALNRHRNEFSAYEAIAGIFKGDR